MAGFISRTAVHARKRAIAKTLCYRVLMVIITILVAWVVVGDVREGVTIGLATNAVKTATYYGYERLWDHISWGIVADG